MDALRGRDILYDDRPLGRWPTHLLRRVAEPTNKLVGPIERRDQRYTAFNEFMDTGSAGRPEGRSEPPSGRPAINQLIGRFPVGAALQDMAKHLGELREKALPVAATKAPIPEDPYVRSRHLKALGYFLGADIMGVAPARSHAFYTHEMDGKPIDPSPFKYAVVFVCQKHDPTISASNGWEDIVDAASFQAYVRLAVQTEIMADYIRRLGWRAEASNITRYLTLMPPLLLEAGIGEVSRMGIVLNPFLGANFKAACVLTDMELEPDGYVDFGLQDYCERCGLCVAGCEAKAIPSGSKTLYNGYYTWKLDARRCAQFAFENREGFICGRCTKICPWHIPGQEPRDFAGWDGSLQWLHSRVDEQKKRVVREHFIDPSEKTDKWWFSLEEKEGRLWPVPDSNR
ncbi:MAG: 4Fe-4S dicluster domain-containing protein [Thermoleophilia bacterium]|nr:4Fe-4S dicluster domain-containing protein [Thermoleophilia bacterium]